MSRLGIAFVLPYVGANGIKVVNNVIEIDPNATITVDEVDANTIVAQAINATFQLFVGSLNPPYTQILPGNINNIGENFITTVTIDADGLVSCQQIVTNLDSDNSPELVFLYFDNAGNLAITVDGENNNSLQVVPRV